MVSEVTSLWYKRRGDGLERLGRVLKPPDGGVAGGGGSPVIAMGLAVDWRVAHLTLYGNERTAVKTRHDSCLVLQAGVMEDFHQPHQVHVGGHRPW